MIDWLVSSIAVQASSDETQRWWNYLRRAGGLPTTLAAAVFPGSLDTFSNSLRSNGLVSAMSSHQLLDTSVTQQSYGGKYAR